MGNIIPVYHYVYFFSVYAEKAGKNLAKFLNEHPGIEIVKLDFTNTDGGTSIHLLYKE